MQIHQVQRVFYSLNLFLICFCFYAQFLSQQKIAIQLCKIGNQVSIQIIEVNPNSSIMKKTLQTNVKGQKNKEQKAFSLRFEEQSELKVRLQSKQRLWMALYQSQNIQFYYEKVFTPENIPNNILQVYDSLMGIFQFISENYQKDLSLGFDDQTANCCWLMMKTTVGKKEKIYRLALQKKEYSQLIKINGKIKILQTEVNHTSELLQKCRQKEEELKLKLKKEEEVAKKLRKNYETIQIEVKKLKAKEQQEQRQRVERKCLIQALQKQIAETECKIQEKGAISNQNFAHRKGRKRKQIQLINNQVSSEKDKVKRKMSSNNRSCILQNKTYDKEQRMNKTINTQHLAYKEMTVQDLTLRQKSVSQRIQSNVSQYIFKKTPEEQEQPITPRTINETNIFKFCQTQHHTNEKFKEENIQKLHSHTQSDIVAPTIPQNKQIFLESKLKGFIYSNSAQNESIISQMPSHTPPSISPISSKDISSKEDFFEQQIGDKVILNLNQSNNIDKYQLIKTKYGQVVKRINKDQLFYYITNSTAITGRQHFVAIIEEINFHDFNFGIRASSALNVPPRQWHSEIICLAGCTKKIIIGTDYISTQLQLKKGDVVVTMADMTQRKVCFYVNKVLVNETKLPGEEKDWYFFVDCATKGNRIRVV